MKEKFSIKLVVNAAHKKMEKCVENIDDSSAFKFSGVFYTIQAVII